MWRVIMKVIVVFIVSVFAGEVFVAATELDQPKGCKIYSLGGTSSESYSPSVNFTMNRSIAVKLPKESWELFSIGFETSDGSSTGVLQFQRNASIVLTLKNWASSNIGPKEATKMLPPHIRPGYFAKQWVKISMERLQEVLTVRINTLEAVITFPEMDISTFQSIFAHVDSDQYIDVGFDCQDSQPLPQTTSSHGLLVVLILLAVGLCAGVVFFIYKLKHKHRKKKSNSDAEKASIDVSNFKSHEEIDHLIGSTKSEGNKQVESSPEKPGRVESDSEMTEIPSENERRWKNSDKIASLTDSVKMTTEEIKRKVKSTSQDLNNSTADPQNGQSPTDNEPNCDNDKNNMKPDNTKDREEKQEEKQMNNTQETSVLQNTQDGPLRTSQDTEDLPEPPEGNTPANTDDTQCVKTQREIEASKNTPEIHTHLPNELKEPVENKTDDQVDDLTNLMGGMKI